MQSSSRFLTEPRIWLNSSPSHEPQAGTGFRQGELSFFWTPWGNLCDAGVRSNSYDPFQDTWREGDEYDASRYKGEGPFFSEAGPSTLSCCSEWSSRANAPLFALLQVNFRKSFLERWAVLFPPPSESAAPLCQGFRQSAGTTALCAVPRKANPRQHCCAALCHAQ